MRIWEVPELDGNERYTDVDSKITKKMVEMLNKCEQENRIVNWDDFYKYCIEFFIVPIVTIERCIERAKKRSNYI